MESRLQHLKTARIEPLFIFLFFFNCFLLPQGITFSLLFTPIWLYLLHTTGRLYLLKYFLLLMGAYAVIHFCFGVDAFYYSVSSILLFGNCIFCIAAVSYLRDPGVNYEYLFRRIVLLNFIFTLISIPLLWVPPLKSLVWYSMSMSDNIRVLPRLKLFCYEASHYSYLLVPVVIYCYGKLLFTAERQLLPALIMITIPLLLSLSFGVIGCLVFSGILIGIIYFRRIFNTGKKRLLLLSGIGVMIVTAYVLYRYFPENILVVRIQNMLDGKDTSARGRTYESFILAQKIIARKSYLWGIGPGQLKVLGRPIIIQYYYYNSIPATIRIPNACAETIVCFGYVGFAIRIAIQLILFFTTQVFKSPYRLWLFLFLFIFQFMGSYITNVTEYVFWILVFSPMLNFFQKK